MARSMPEAPKTWILTGSPENFNAARGNGFRLIVMKQRRRTQVLEMRKWPRTVSDADAALDRVRAAAGTPA